MGLEFFLYDGGGTTEEFRVKKRDIVIFGRLVAKKPPYSSCFPLKYGKVVACGLAG